MILIMSKSYLTSDDYSKLAKLAKERDRYQAKVDELQAEIDQIQSNGNSPSVRKSGTRGPKKGAKPGQVKEAILMAVKAAGTEGISVADLAGKLSLKKTNVYSWFNATGKKIKGLQFKDGKYTAS